LQFQEIEEYNLLTKENKDNKEKEGKPTKERLNMIFLKTPHVFNNVHYKNEDK